MSVRTLQAQRALKVIPSSIVDIPYPDRMVSGNVSSYSTEEGWIEVSGINFIELGVASGDILYFVNLPYATAVLNIDVNNPSRIFLVGGVNDFFAGQYFDMYKGGQNRGCTLYIGTPGDILVIPAGGGDPEIVVNAPQIFPIQVVSIWENGTSASDIIALW